MKITSKDLISRKAVMKILSDKNKDGMPDDATGRIRYEFIEDLIDEIRDNIPQVFDLENTICQLENKIIGLINLKSDEPTVDVAIKELMRAIEIIKENIEE